MEVIQQHQSRGGAVPASDLGEFLVICLCAEWCGVCREYRSGFEALANEFPMAVFRWIDIEAQADHLGDIDVENFPTLLIKRRDAVLYYGTMQPSPGQLKRLLRALVQQTAEESREYALSSDERRTWQADADLRRLGAGATGK